MNKIIVAAFITAMFFLTSCGKNTPENATETLPTGTTLSTGTFTSNGHTTSGTVKVIVDASNKKFLVFENFKTDNAPDLRVRLSPNNSGSPYEEIGALKAVNGSFSYELSATVNHTSNNRVLIWCRPFSVLFGNAILQ